jgi:uncharacterized protein (DUF2336 family)
MKKQQLTQANVDELMANPSAEARAKAAELIADEYRQESLNAREQAIAEDIFRALVRDVEICVRQALADQLKQSRLVPHDVAVSLAHDVDAVALPILESCEVLTSADLIEIVRSQAPTKQVAIARRRNIPEPVADALIETKNAEAVAVLVSNDGAQLSEKTLESVLDEYNGHEAIKERLAFRFKVPPRVAARLVDFVTDRLKDHLMSNRVLPADTVSDLVQFSRERATLGIVWGAGTSDLDRFLRQLHAHGRLTPTLLLRALCMGDRLFFETGIAVRADVPLRNAVALIYDQSHRGFGALYEKAGLPAHLFPAFAIAIDVARQTELDVLDGDRERYRSRVIERILTQFEDVGADNLDYLLAKLGRRGTHEAVAAG